MINKYALKDSLSNNNFYKWTIKNFIYFDIYKNKKKYFVELN